MNLHTIITDGTSNFDVARYILAHMIKQGKPAMGVSYCGDDIENDALDELACKYRGDDGTSCAVGCLLTDEDMLIVKEGDGASDVLEELNLERELAHLLPLLRSVQKLHDSYADRHVEAEILRDANGDAIINAATLRERLNDLVRTDNKMDPVLCMAVAELQA